MILKDNCWHLPAEGEKVVTGVAVFNRKNGSKRKGIFRTTEVSMPKLWTMTNYCRC